MRVNGIIAEYNPFHNGHRYQMEESRRLTGADYTVVVMSGDFVQRGAPALADKHARAEMSPRSTPPPAPRPSPPGPWRCSTGWGP